MAFLLCCCRYCSFLFVCVCVCVCCGLDVCKNAACYEHWNRKSVRIFLNTTCIYVCVRAHFPSLKIHSPSSVPIRCVWCAATRSQHVKRLILLRRLAFIYIHTHTQQKETHSLSEWKIENGLIKRYVSEENV